MVIVLLVLAIICVGVLLLYRRWEVKKFGKLWICRRKAGDDEMAPLTTP